MACFPKTVRLCLINALRGPQPRTILITRFGLLQFRSPLLSESILSFFSCRYLDVSVHGVPLCTLFIHIQIPEVPSGRFPHSDIRGSMAICASPRLFAAYHVFLRLLVPRHSPCALPCLTFSRNFVASFSSMALSHVFSTLIHHVLLLLLLLLSIFLDSSSFIRFSRC